MWSRAAPAEAVFEGAEDGDERVDDADGEEEDVVDEDLG